MYLWATLSSHIGTTDNKIILTGKFALEGDSSHPQGPVVAINSYMPDKTIYIGDEVVEGSVFQNPETIYWLPWRHGEITTAMFTDMSASGCKYFLTSTFSGCRFVATDTSASHIAFMQNGFGNTSDARDMSEWNRLHGGTSPILRRKLSVDGINKSSDMGALISSNSTYGIGQDASGTYQGNAVVMGYKTEDWWNFKTLIYNVGSSYWHNLN